MDKGHSQPYKNVVLALLFIYEIFHIVKMEEKPSISPSVPFCEI